MDREFFSGDEPWKEKRSKLGFGKVVNPRRINGMVTFWMLGTEMHRSSIPECSTGIW